MNTIKLPDGRQAIVLTPVDSTELAIVHLPVIKRLASLLPRVNIQEIIAEMQGKLDVLSNRHAGYNSTNPVTIKEYISVLDEEISFHKTVNLIESLDPSDLTDAEKAGLAGHDISAGIDKANKALVNEGALDD